MSLRTRGAVACSLVLLTVGCSDSPPEIHAPELSAADAQACRDFVADLPDTLAGQESVEVTGDTEYGAAWGDPAIVLRCGVALPKDYAGAPCITRNGIGWSIPLEQADELGVDVVMTLAFRTPVVQLRVPAAYRPESPADVMADLDPAVRAHTTAHGKCT